ncbi:MAG: hypothetical protein RIF32_11430 [Leptospirales bacterium]
MQNWNTLSGGSGANVKEARLQLHHAVQPLAAAGAALIPSRADYTHTSLESDPESGALLGAPFGQSIAKDNSKDQSKRGVRGALFFEDISLALVADGEAFARASLRGKSLAAAFAWFAGALKDAGYTTDLKGDPLNLTLPEYPDYPEHSLVTEESLFNADPERAVEVRRYFENSQRLLKNIIAKFDGASPATVWPHHFDLATLITLKEPTEEGGEDGQSVGAGLSPGDMGNDAPYWYVTPWPYPDKDRLPKLTAGRWNTDGWVGAQLDAAEVLAAKPGEQESVVESFLYEAVQASVDLISSK